MIKSPSPSSLSLAAKIRRLVGLSSKYSVTSIDMQIARMIDTEYKHRLHKLMTIGCSGGLKTNKQEEKDYNLLADLSSPKNGF